MRKAPTDAERALWRSLRGKQLLGYRFRRQQPIGPFIVDFVCFERRLIVEADGSQHLDSAYDARRDGWLRAQGFDLLRVWNNDVLARPASVLEAIVGRLTAPHPSPPPQGGREQEQEHA